MASQSAGRDVEHVESFKPPRRLLGYKRSAVEEFKRSIASSMSAAVHEKDELSQRLGQLEHELLSQKAAIGEAILAAARTSETMVEEAGRKSEAMIAEAREQAAAIVRTGEEQLRRQKAEAQQVRGFADRIRTEARTMLGQWMEQLRSGFPSADDLPGSPMPGTSCRASTSEEEPSAEAASNAEHPAG